MRLRRFLVLGGLLFAMPAIADPLVHPDQTIPDSATTSPITAAFVAAVGPFNRFLEASDRLAVARGHGAAAGRARARDAVVAELRAWADGIARERFAEAHAPTIDRLGPVFGLFGGRIDVVAIPPDLQQRRDLVELERLDGSAFDALLARSQTATLLQLETTYIDYIKNGDDQVLRALSVRDLGRVRSLLTRRQAR